jgi:putative acetyltransferase
VIIRPALVPESARIAALAAASYAGAFADILEPDVLATYGSGFFADRFAGTWPRLRVADSFGELLGFSLVTDGHLDMLFIDPAAQGCGAGSALLGDAVLRGTRSLESFHENLLARRFYERHGWGLTRSYRRVFAGRERDFVFYERLEV